MTDTIMIFMYLMVYFLPKNKKVCSNSYTPEKCAAVHCRDASVIHSTEDAKAGAFLHNKNAPLWFSLFTCVAGICYHRIPTKASANRNF